jgi:hypothetical protein
VAFPQLKRSVPQSPGTDAAQSRRTREAKEGKSGVLKGFLARGAASAVSPVWEQRLRTRVALPVKPNVRRWQCEQVSTGLSHVLFS